MSARVEISRDNAEKIKFTVDSALLRELGERLVGKPYIALAELVKNSYDADATEVVIRFGPDTIEVIDNGHGMDYSEFQSFWMRVGTQHKQAQRFSREFGRPVTGSKGIGRLAVQFLAQKITMRTLSNKQSSKELEVFIDWAEAVKAGELTEAEALYREIPPNTVFPQGKKHGTQIVLSGLNQSWSADAIVDLAREIWPLQPPFQAAPDAPADKDKVFHVELISPDKDAVEKFNLQISAVLDIWTARMFGRLSPSTGSGDRKVNLVLEFSDGTRFEEEYSVPESILHFLQFEIRVFTLQRRQPYGIRVEDAREYFRRFGGVHVYDAGFHLPYYGTVESDWLRIQYDQASRLSRSQLIPEELQVSRGLQFLPTISRLFGVVHVNTAYEQVEANKHTDTALKEEYLKIQVTRDRLVDNSAYQNLVKIVRWALDYYAMREAARNLEELEALRPIEPIREKFERVDRILDLHRAEIPEPVFNTLRTEVRDAVRSSETEIEINKQQTALLGALATAGMSALAYEHESKKLHFQLYNVIKDIEAIKTEDPEIKKQLNAVVVRLNQWMDQSRAIRSLFTSLLDEDNREISARFKAHDLIGDISSQLGVLLRGIRPKTYRIDVNLRLPLARYADWNAIFQNVFLNAVNAMLDTPEKRIDVSSRIEGKSRMLLIQDTGVGVDLETAKELFEPFIRKLEISPERKGLGLGGSGLGLTIVRMISESIGCRVSFVEPEQGYNTAFQITWTET